MYSTDVRPNPTIPFGAPEGEAPNGFFSVWLNAFDWNKKIGVLSTTKVKMKLYNIDMDEPRYDAGRYPDYYIVSNKTGKSFQFKFLRYEGGRGCWVYKPMLKTCPVEVLRIYDL